jgi:hypothetical protein
MIHFKFKPASEGVIVRPVESPEKKMYKLDFSIKGHVIKIYVNKFGRGVYFEN